MAITTYIISQNSTGRDFTGVEDIQIRGTDANSNQGNTVLRASSWSGQDQRSSLIRATGMSSLPPGGTIVGVRLKLYQTNWVDYQGTGAQTSLHIAPCLRNWVVNQATWNSFATGNAWAVAGGQDGSLDFESTTNVNFGTVGDSAQNNSYVTYDLSTIASVFDAIYKGTRTNNGVIISRLPRIATQLEEQEWRQSGGADGQRPIWEFDIETSSGGTASGSYSSSFSTRATQSGSYSTSNTTRNSTTGSYSSQNTVRNATAGSYTTSNTVRNSTAGSFTSSNTVKNAQAGSYTSSNSIRATQAGSYTSSNTVANAQSGSYSGLFSTDGPQIAATTYTSSFSVQNTAAGSYSSSNTVRATQAGSYSSSNTVRNTTAGSYSSQNTVRNSQTGAYTTSFHTIAAAAGSYSSIFSIVPLDRATGEFTSSFSMVGRQLASYSSSFTTRRTTSGAYSAQYRIFESFGGVIDGSYVPSITVFMPEQNRTFSVLSADYSEQINEISAESRTYVIKKRG